MKCRISLVYPVFVLLCAAAFVSCRKENTLDCFKANGPDVTEIRRPGVFTDIDIFDKMDLHVKQGPEYSVQLRAGRNIIKNIQTEVSDGVLNINNLNTCNFVRGYERKISITVTTPYLRYLKNSGVAPAVIDENFVQDTLLVRAENSGDIYIKGNYQQIRTSSHGNGDLYISGRCNSFYIYTYGTNHVHAEKLKVRDFSFVHSQSLGDCTVSADSLYTLACTIENQGNVYYHGEPARIVNYSDPEVKGKLLKK